MKNILEDLLRCTEATAEAVTVRAQMMSEQLYIKFEKGLDEDSFEVLDSKAYLWS